MLARLTISLEATFIPSGEPARGGAEPSSMRGYKGSRYRDIAPRSPMFNSADYPELQPELIRYLEFCYALPAYDSGIAKMCEQVARLFSNPEQG
jgi:hypothetical protein